MKKDEKNIAILGCGWLGFPLAKKWIADGNKIKGSTTTPSKISGLKSAGIEAYCVELQPNQVVGEWDPFLSETKILLIDIPPKLRKAGSESFVSKIKTLLPAIHSSQIEQVILVSSTSVYGTQSGDITEETTPQPDTESGKQLLEVEQILLNDTHFSTTIVRFGGLIGADRHPIQMLAGRENVENPNGWINFIHLEDCIGILDALKKQNFPKGIFNGVAPFHPSRKAYYEKVAAERGLKPPVFVEEDHVLSRKIISAKIESELEYQFVKPML